MNCVLVERSTRSQQNSHVQCTVDLQRSPPSFHQEVVFNPVYKVFHSHFFGSKAQRFWFLQVVFSWSRFPLWLNVRLLGARIASRKVQPLEAECVITFNHVLITKIWVTIHSRAVGQSLIEDWSTFGSSVSTVGKWLRLETCCLWSLRKRVKSEKYQRWISTGECFILCQASLTSKTETVSPFSPTDKNRRQRSRLFRDVKYSSTRRLKARCEGM
jgi:hypothetical protein